MANVLILMGTFNGARYIREQIASIQAQTLSDWTLLVRDDGSSDNTVEIIEELARADDRIVLCRDDLGNLGVTANFGRLMQLARERTEPWIAFADQDDVWLPEKLALSLAALPASAGAEPVLLHTDLQVVDAGLQLLHPSFLAYQHLRHVDAEPLNTLLVHNFVTGCTMVMNRALLDVATPVPPEAVLHDRWLAACAATWGRLLFLPQATLKYRQHGGNVRGAGGVLRYLKPAALLRKLGHTRSELRACFAQANALLQREQSRPSAHHAVLAGFNAIFTLPRFSPRRLGLLRRLGVSTHKPLKNLLLWWEVLRAPVKAAE